MPQNVRETTVEFASANGFTSDKALNFFLERYAGRLLSQRARYFHWPGEGEQKPLHPDGDDAGLKGADAR